MRRLFYQYCHEKNYPLAATLRRTPSRSTVNSKERSNRVPKSTQSSSVKHRARFVPRMHSDLSRLVVDTLQLHLTKNVSLAGPYHPFKSESGCLGPTSSRGKEQNSQNQRRVGRDKTWKATFAVMHMSAVAGHILLSGLRFWDRRMGLRAYRSPYA